MPQVAMLADLLAPLRADPSRSAVLLDIDGTLAPIVRHADDAHVAEPTRTRLIEIAKRYGLVACVSGRRAAEARRIVALGTITYVGNHGLELLPGGSRVTEVDPAIREWSVRVAAFARRWDTPTLSRLRVRLEDKDAIAAFHWRGAPDEDAAVAVARDIAADAEAEGLGTHWGRKVLEVRPAVPFDKGRGVEALLARYPAIVNAVYAGDDATDLDAFAALDRQIASGRLAHAVRVGVASNEGPAEIADRADVMVDGTPGVNAMLDGLVRDAQ